VADPFGGEEGEFGYWEMFPGIVDEVRDSAAEFADTMREEAGSLRDTYRQLNMETGEITRAFAEHAAAVGGRGAGWLGGRAAGYEAGKRAGGVGPPDDREAEREEARRRGAGRETIYELWYLRIVSQQVKAVERLGTQLMQTAGSWAFYAARAEEAANAAANVSLTHGELSSVLREQREVTIEMREELGEALLPAYKDSIEVVTSLKRTIAELSDGWQAAIGITTTAVGIFLKVSAAIALTAISASMALTVYQSLNVAMQASILAGMQYGVVVGTIVATMATLTMGWSRWKSDLQEAADILRDNAMLLGLSGEAMAEMAQAYYDNLPLMSKALFNLMGGMDAFIDKMMTGGSELGTVFEQAVRAAEDMVLPAAQAFQSLADAQSDIQNEMLTTRREYARVMERINSGMYSEQDMAQATALEAQMRRLEIADMQMARAHERQMGQIVVQTIQAWERIGRYTPEQAYGMIEEAMLAFEMISPEALARGREFMGRYKAEALGVGEGVGPRGIPGEALEALVTRVIDGDTIRVKFRDSGIEESLRYIGINAPEMFGAVPEAGAIEAWEKNVELLEGMKVWVEMGIEERDIYGRLLGYVWTQDAFINALMVQGGYAETMAIAPNIKYAGYFSELERGGPTQVVALENNTVALEELTAAVLGVYLPLPALKEPTMGEELRTEGIRTRR